MNRSKIRQTAVMHSTDRLLVVTAQTLKKYSSDMEAEDAWLIDGIALALRTVAVAIRSGESSIIRLNESLKQFCADEADMIAANMREGGG